MCLQVTAKCNDHMGSSELLAKLLKTCSYVATVCNWTIVDLVYVLKNKIY